MKLFCSVIVSVLSVCRVHSADMFQDWRNCTVGALLQPSEISSSGVGPGTWQRDGAGTAYKFWYCASNAPVALRVPETVGTNVFTTTGTKWIRYDLTNSQPAVGDESVGFIIAGGSPAAVKYSIGRAVVRWCATNSGPAGSNLDTINTQGNPFGVVQLQTTTSNGLFAVIGHVQSHNGAWINLIPCETYQLQWIRDDNTGTFTLDVWDSSGAHVGQSIGTPMSTSGGFWWLRLNANYLNLNLSGYVEIGAVSLAYTESGIAQSGVTTLESMVRSNRFAWAPGTNVGAMGGAWTNSGTVIDATAAPYLADKTGATDAGGAINAAVAAAASNDVVYLPGGLYWCPTAIGVDKDGVTLRGAGTNTVIVGTINGGHSQSGNQEFAITNGGTMGTTNLVLSSLAGTFVGSIEAGDAFTISGLEDDTNGVFPVISLTGYRRIMDQVVSVAAMNGNTVSLTAPLVWNYTNSPVLKSLNLTGNSGLRFKQRVAFENFYLTTTNSGKSVTPTALMSLSSLMNFQVRGVTIEYPVNYCLAVSASLHGLIEGNNFGKATSAGTSRSGITMSTVSGVLVQDNAFYDLTVGLQAQGGGFSGNVVAFNFFTNISDKPMLLHNTHPHHNLWEGNVGGYLMPDGYFGSQSHDDVFRNHMATTLSFKRNVSHFNVVGNVLGNTNAAYVYERTDSGFNAAPWPIFTFGYPNISNNGFTGEAPPVGWNFPGNPIPNIQGGPAITNGVFVFNGTYGPTNVLWSHMGTGTFTNIPAPYSQGYPLRFQDGVNTNKYWPDDGTIVLSATNGTSSNLVLNVNVTVSNGWRLFIAGQAGYGHRQSLPRGTFFLSGNLVYTNAAGTVVWDDRAGRVIPGSLLYTNGAPSWWGTNRWPAVQPEAAVKVTPIPAELRYAGISSGEPIPPATNGPAAGAIRATRVHVGTLRRL